MHAHGVCTTSHVARALVRVTHAQACARVCACIQAPFLQHRELWWAFAELGGAAEAESIGPRLLGNIRHAKDRMACQTSASKHTCERAIRRAGE
eukprot:15476516-Alexandrium_andersonii.AAC.1